MIKYRMVLDADGGCFSPKLQGWEGALIQKLVHLYYEWNAEVLLTESDLHRVHKHFTIQNLKCFAPS